MTSRRLWCRWSRWLRRRLTRATASLRAGCAHRRRHRCRRHHPLPPGGVVCEVVPLSLFGGLVGVGRRRGLGAFRLRFILRHWLVKALTPIHARCPIHKDCEVILLAPPAPPNSHSFSRMEATLLAPTALANTVCSPADPPLITLQNDALDPSAKSIAICGITAGAVKSRGGPHSCRKRAGHHTPGTHRTLSAFRHSRQKWLQTHRAREHGRRDPRQSPISPLPSRSRVSRRLQDENLAASR